MKTYPGKHLPFVITLLSFFILSGPASGQDSAGVSQQILDMKLELLNSQIDLFNSQLKVWESKPAVLEQRLADVDRRIDNLNFDPVYFNNKLSEIEMLIEEQKAEQMKAEELMTETLIARELMADELKAAEQGAGKKGFHPFRPDSVVTEPYKTAIAMNPVRLIEGTFHMTYERSLTPRLGLGISALATYATEEGISGYYMRNQELDYYNAALSSTLSYNDKNISGYGLEVNLKNYLLTDHYIRQRSPVGLYAAPGFLFRRLWLSGISEYYLEDEWIEEEITRLLNIYSFEAHIGWKFTFLKVLYVDVYAGGLIRLAKYDDEKGFTKYKSLGNIDFSGVMPTAGISIGILK